MKSLFTILNSFVCFKLVQLNFSSADHVPSSKVFIDYFGVVTFSFESMAHKNESLTFYSVEKDFNECQLKLNHKDIGNNDYLKHKSHAIFGDGSIKFNDFYVFKISCYQVIQKYEQGNQPNIDLDEYINLLVLQSTNNQYIGIRAIEGEDQGDSSIYCVLGRGEVSLELFVDQFCGKKGYSRGYGNFVEVPKLLYQISE